MSHPSPALSAACLSVGLVSAWAPSAQGDVQTQIDITTSGLYGSVSHAVLLLAGLGSGYSGLAPITFSNLTLLPSNNLTYLSGLALTDFGNSYALIGLSLGSGSSNFHLVLSAPHLTVLSGLTFDQAFPNSPMSEQQLIDDLLLGTGQGAALFLRTNFALLGQNDGVECATTHFSEGADFGTLNVTLTSIPAPTALALLPLGCIVSLRRRR